MRKNCPDCNVEYGHPHEDGCDCEICTVCGTQRMLCDCEGHDKIKARFGNFDDELSAFWFENYLSLDDEDSPVGHCVLCSMGSGIINTQFGQYFCICPNGQAMKRIRGKSGRVL